MGTPLFTGAVHTRLPLGAPLDQHLPICARRRIVPADLDLAVGAAFESADFAGLVARRATDRSLADQGGATDRGTAARLTNLATVPAHAGPIALVLGPADLPNATSLPAVAAGPAHVLAIARHVGRALLALAARLPAVAASRAAIEIAGETVTAGGSAFAAYLACAAAMRASTGGADLTDSAGGIPLAASLVHAAARNTTLRDTGEVGLALHGRIAASLVGPAAGLFDALRAGGQPGRRRQGDDVPLQDGGSLPQVLDGRRRPEVRSTATAERRYTAAGPRRRMRARWKEYSSEGIGLQDVEPHLEQQPHLLWRVDRQAGRTAAVDR